MVSSIAYEQAHLFWGFVRVSWGRSRGDLSELRNGAGKRVHAYGATRGSAAAILARDPKQVSLLAGYE